MNYFVGYTLRRPNRQATRYELSPFTFQQLATCYKLRSPLRGSAIKVCTASAFEMCFVYNNLLN